MSLPFHPDNPTNTMHRITIALRGILTAGIASLIVHSACADTFSSGPNAFTIDFVTVGNAGNADDVNNPYPNPGDGGTPFGGVSYLYRMGVTEVPQDWITKATTLGMTNVTAGAWTGLQPAANMSWYEAAAFVNWLNTSKGHQAAYDLTFSGGWSVNLWSSGQAWQAGGENLYGHKDAYYFLPNEDEWYKAAYHKNDGVTANYWDYATASNTAPTAVGSGTGAGTAVFFTGSNSSPAEVIAAGGLSAYGTRGQGGNVWEWTESAYDGVNDSASENRYNRGGYWGSGTVALQSSFRFSVGNDPSSEDNFRGFRVASVPEPTTAGLLLMGLGTALMRRRRREQRAA
jgi:hypothetical protein